MKRLPSLDILRVLLIACVLPMHNVGIDCAWSIQRFGLAETAVDCFFVLSGFVIVRSLYADALESRTFSDRFSALKRFYIRRTLRLCPPYFALLALCSFVVPAIITWNGSKPIYTQIAFYKAPMATWFYAHNYWCIAQRIVHDNPYGNLWSLAVEEQFYCLAAPLVLLVIPPNKLRDFVFYLAFPAGVMGAAWNQIIGSVYIALSPQLIFFATGAFIALSPSPSPRLITALAWLAGMALWGRATVGDDCASHLGRWVVATSALLVALHWGQSAIDRTPRLFGHWTEFLGRMTYGIYLWHFAPARILAQFIEPGQRLSTILMLVTIALALASYKLIEEPCTRLGRWLTSKRVHLVPHPPTRSAAAIRSEDRLVPSLEGFGALGADEPQYYIPYSSVFGCLEQG